MVSGSHLATSVSAYLIHMPQRVAHKLNQWRSQKNNDSDYFRNDEWGSFANSPDKIEIITRTQ